MSGVPRVGVLALQGDVREHVAALRAAGLPENAVFEVRTPTDLDHVDGLVLPGGESTTVGRLLRSAGLDEHITRRAVAGMPLFATCAGVILLANEIAGSQQLHLGLLPVRIERNAYGRQVDSFETRLEVPGMGQIEAVFIRAPRIVMADPSVRVLARYRGDPVLCSFNKILAATFHPELTVDGRLHRYFLAMIGSHQA